MSNNTSKPAPKGGEKTAAKRKPAAKKAADGKSASGKAPKRASSKTESAPKARKSAATRKAPARRASSRRPARVVISNEDIALRAYYLAEKRRAAGLAGSEHGDWLEAERQLRAEAGK